uniref:Epididymal secretory protein 4 n=1 Tax=Zootoca vivipara TaxID=8524 RepID=ESP4_ZOOVI|nr:RecName: Full=Epididymal secretory protein 4; AltName: Full=C731; AltName: Full=Epididymal secretory protein IV; AltName: Full=LESP IV; Flags: Precursor [Zootoca vivipara]CAA44854.1 Lizard Epididymal Secretory Protein IV [Zootoca vivipara]CAA50491.1 Lizard Epididymal Secretory Protein [Zootoca vivipara]
MIAVLLLVFGMTPDYIFPVSADIPVVPNFDAQKTVGKWHPIGMASKLPEVPEYEQKISPMDHMVELTDGDMKLTANYMDGVCKEATAMLKHTDKPGVFKFTGGEIRMMDIDYEKYLIMYMKKSTFEAMYLSARGSDVGDDIKEKFKKLVLEQNFPEAHIKYFNAEQCTPTAA